MASVNKTVKNTNVVNTIATNEMFLIITYEIDDDDLSPSMEYIY